MTAMNQLLPKNAVAGCYLDPPICTAKSCGQIFFGGYESETVLDLGV